MPVLDVTEEQIISLLAQLSPERGAHILERFQADPAQSETERSRPRFGKGKNAIASIADDFDAPLEDMKEYMY